MLTLNLAWHTVTLLGVLVWVCLCVRLCVCVCVCACLCRPRASTFYVFDAWGGGVLGLLIGMLIPSLNAKPLKPKPSIAALALVALNLVNMSNVNVIQFGHLEA